MKWIFILALIGMVPALTGWLRQNRQQLPKVAMALGFLPFVQGSWHLMVAPISWAMWPGYVKGLEVSLIDALALAICLGVRNRQAVHLKLPFLCYIAATVLAAAFANVAQASLFYSWQLLRVFLLFYAVARLCAEDDRTPGAIVTGMVAGLAYQAVFAIKEYLGGALQTGGTFGHQNLLGLISHCVVLPALAMLLAGKKGWAPRVGPIAGIIVVVLTASRATIGLAGGGYVALLVTSMARKWTSRKAAVAGAGVLALLIAAPLAMSSLNKRFEAVPLGGYDERAAFERAAHMMIDDHPMGVGANQYVVVANSGGYSARAGVVWTWTSRSANVHNTYLLVWAETGYLGLATFLVFILTPIWVAFRCSWRNRNDPRGDVLLGLGAALGVVAVHSMYEWIFVTFHAEYVVGLTMGLVVGLAQQLGYWGGRQRRERAAPARRKVSVEGGALPVPASLRTPPLPKS